MTASTGDVEVMTFAELDPATAYAVWPLRQRVFVVEQRAPYPDLDGRDPEPSTRHLLVREAGELVAYLRLLDDGAEARIGRVVVAPEARGRGYADELMRAAMLETGDRAVVLDAQTGLAGWYCHVRLRGDWPGVRRRRRAAPAHAARGLAAEGPLRSRSSVRATRCP